MRWSFLVVQWVQIRSPAPRLYKISSVNLSKKKRVLGMICAGMWASWSLGVGNRSIGTLAALTADLPAETTLTSHPSVRTTLEQSAWSHFHVLFIHSSRVARIREHLFSEA